MVQECRLKASPLEELPAAFEFEGRRFSPLNLSLGDVDYLRNERNQLVGFGCISGDEIQELLFCQRLAQQGGSVEFKDGWLLLFLSESKSHDIQCVQAIGTEVYQNGAGGFIFVIPDLGFGELGFDLVSEDVPVVV